MTAAMLARSLADPLQDASVGPVEQWAGVRSAYLALLNEDAGTEVEIGVDAQHGCLWGELAAEVGGRSSYRLS
ncbi:hypothetical protein [Streptomyces sp. NBC_00057]|uniref:hypothetical protein n=1 Tax=Streptomyces sp. NBC_00057 TaxID=2975634 RepID=UPI00324CFB8C